MFQNLGQLVLLIWKTLKALPDLGKQRAKFVYQLYEIGNGSLLMTCMLSLFIGGVLALQTGPLLAERGMSTFMGGIVGLSACRELAPVMIAILITGRNGSAMAAEIGSMRVYQEIDALRTMNIDPIRFLVLPRITAITVAVPLLVGFAILFSWFGGGLVCVMNNDIGISFQAYYSDLKEVVGLSDVLNGLIKSTVFATAVGTVCCHQGLTTLGGPRGIGRSVTKAVVNSIVIILILDYGLTRLLMHFE